MGGPFLGWSIVKYCEAKNFKKFNLPVWPFFVIFKVDKGNDERSSKAGQTNCKKEKNHVQKYIRILCRTIRTEQDPMVVGGKQTGSYDNNNNYNNNIGKQPDS